MVARSLGLGQKPIRLKDSQYFFFPLLTYRKSNKAPSFTLAELFVEILNSAVSPYFTHFQVYGLNSLFRQTIRDMVPAFLRHPWLLDQVEKRFVLMQGFLHSEDSGALDLELQSSSERRDRVTIRGIANSRSAGVARSAQRLLRKQMLRHGIIPPFYLKMVPLGRSFHLGGSFPMGGKDPLLSSDRLGRPAGLRRASTSSTHPRFLRFRLPRSRSAVWQTPTASCAKPSEHRHDSENRARYRWQPGPGSRDRAPAGDARLSRHDRRAKRRDCRRGHEDARRRRPPRLGA